VGQAMVRALAAAGAHTIWAGYALPRKPSLAVHELRKISQVTWVPLDVTSAISVKTLAAKIGSKVDTVINTATSNRIDAVASQTAVNSAQADMDVNYFGLLRLAQAFGPVMRARSSAARSSACAWVNLLSVFALSNFPARGSFSASMAAAQSLSQCLRAEMRAAAVRVINVFPGPIDAAENRSLPPPKLTPQALAKTIVMALRDAVEDVYPGEVAQDWLARWLDCPKILEQELTV
jgi:NAD(P)-dependent dehydrogenase (short-subunit alcohol dehydrogenase family)